MTNQKKGAALLPIFATTASLVICLTQGQSAQAQNQDPALATPAIAQVCFGSRDSTTVRILRESNSVIPDFAISRIVSITPQNYGFARQSSDFIRIPTEKQMTTDTWIENVARRFDRNVPAFSDILRNSQNRFKMGGYVLHQSMPIESTHAAISSDSAPDLCLNTPIAVQSNTMGQHALYIDDRLFLHPQHSEAARKLLMLHEFVRSHARLRGQMDDSVVRQLIERMLMRDSKLTVQEWVGFLIQSGLAAEGEKSLTYTERFKTAMTRDLEKYRDERMLYASQYLGREGFDSLRHLNDCTLGKDNSVLCSVFGPSLSTVNHKFKKVSAFVFGPLYGRYEQYWKAPLTELLLDQPGELEKIEARLHAQTNPEQDLVISLKGPVPYGPSTWVSGSAGDRL